MIDNAVPSPAPGVAAASSDTARSRAVAVAIDRSFAHWNAGNVAGALESCREALDLDPSNAVALANMGTLVWLNGDVDEAEALYARAHAIDPAHVGVLINLATLRNEAGDLEATLHWIEKAQAQRPHSPEVVWRRGLLDLAMGDYANGWRRYEAGLGHEALRGKMPPFAKPAWKGDPCERLLLWHEQGLGDTVQFVRYAALCKSRAGKVIVLCPPELVALIESCPHVDQVVTGVRSSMFDQHVSIMSLPHLFRTTLDSVPATVPYLHADPARVARWAGRMPSGALKVGLAWAGNSRGGQLRFQVIDRTRSIALDALEPWLELQGPRFYSLQKGDAARQAKGRNIVDFMDEVNDFADTAAIIANLDLVICVDTSVAHVAGALGKPVWVLSRLDACWRWLRNRPDSPWYPTARVFGQTTRGEWDAVIAMVRDELAAL